MPRKDKSKKNTAPVPPIRQEKKKIDKIASSKSKKKIVIKKTRDSIPLVTDIEENSARISTKAGKVTSDVPVKKDKVLSLVTNIDEDTKPDEPATPEKSDRSDNKQNKEKPGRVLSEADALKDIELVPPVFLYPTIEPVKPVINEKKVQEAKIKPKKPKDYSMYKKGAVAGLVGIGAAASAYGMYQAKKSMDTLTQKTQQYQIDKEISKKKIHELTVLTDQQAGALKKFSEGKTT